MQRKHQGGGADHRPKAAQQQDVFRQAQDEGIEPLGLHGLSHSVEPLFVQHLLSPLGRKTIFIGCGTGLARADEAGIEGHAPIDVNRGALNVIRFVGGEPHGDARDILRFPNSLRRN